ncbi:NUDIX hydrolase [Deinococcus sp. QL22]|uniref:NUDIX hydrolase n=1 Tax=Deinococcus sp. QL22 TaxID=2939437 RepID=UPI0020183DDE|nr:NUDIX domain-containing protein [Deinococcus sp. QL22]UQN06132.1 NUDIX domain-containing protein [Deinococcus sp. QL22]
MVDLDVHLGEIRFNSRVAVLVVRDNHILLNRFDGATFWFTPGGRIVTGESSEQAARREFLEETGAVLDELRLALVAEIFGQIKGQKIHNLEFYYIATGIPELPNGGFANISDDGVTFEWFPLDGLEQLDIQPPSWHRCCLFYSPRQRCNMWSITGNRRESPYHRPRPSQCEAVVHAVGGPIPTWNELTIPLQARESADSKCDKINPAERSDNSPVPFGGGKVQRGRRQTRSPSSNGGHPNASRHQA